MAEAHYNLGIALREKGLIEEAIISFENFIKCAPPNLSPYIERVKILIEMLKRR